MKVKIKYGVIDTDVKNLWKANAQVGGLKSTIFVLHQKNVGWITVDSVYTLLVDLMTILLLLCLALIVFGAKMAYMRMTKASVLKTKDHMFPKVDLSGVQKMACTIPVTFVEKNMIGTKTVMSVSTIPNLISNVVPAETVMNP